MRPIRHVNDARSSAPRFGGAREAPAIEGLAPASNTRESATGVAAAARAAASSPIPTAADQLAAPRGTNADVDEAIRAVRARAEAASKSASRGAGGGVGLGDFISFSAATGGASAAAPRDSQNPFDSGNDSVASSSDGATAYDRMKRTRRIDRHFAGFERKPAKHRAAGSSRSQPLLPAASILGYGDDDEDEDEDADSAEEPVSASISSEDGGEGDENERGCDGSSAGESAEGAEGTRAEVAEQPTAQSPRQRCDTFRGAVFESRAATPHSGFADLTLMSVTRPVSIRGPCVVIGIAGEVVVGGCYIGRGCVRLLHRHSVCSIHPAACRLDVKGRATEVLDDIDVHGTIDWAWIEARLSDRRARHSGSLPPLIVVASKAAQGMRRGADLQQQQQQQHRRLARPSDSTSTEVPPFFSTFAAPTIDAGLLPSVVPSVLRSRSASVAVVGAQNIGKSTLCRYFANAFFSLRGECMWLDIDLGQPEFGVSGCVTLARLRRPLFGGLCGDPNGAEVLRTYFVGSSRARCPVLMSRVLARIASDAAELRGGSPLVVNTHGWIFSTGRRTTLELLRRVRPGHVVHMLSPASGREDPAATPWLTQHLVDSVADGLNAAVVPRRFRQLIPGCDLALPRGMAAAAEAEPVAGQRAAAKRPRDSDAVAVGSSEQDAQPLLEIHRVVVDRQLAAKPAAESRRHQWGRYFSIPPHLVAAQDACNQRHHHRRGADHAGFEPMQRLVVALDAVCVVLMGAEVPARPIRRDAACALSGIVVGIVTSRTTDAASEPDSAPAISTEPSVSSAGASGSGRESGVAKTEVPPVISGQVIRAEQWMAPQPVGAFGIVVTQEHDIVHTGLVTLFVPRREATKVSPPGAQITHLLVSTDRGDTDWIAASMQLRAHLTPRTPRP